MPDSTVARSQEAMQDDAINTLASETSHPIPVVKRVFEREYGRLSAEARIKDYLLLFAVRRTRDALARGTSPSSG